MTTSYGCATLIGAFATLLLSDGAMAASLPAETCPIPQPIPSSINAAQFGSVCHVMGPEGPVDYSNGTSVCLASISQAVSCARAYFHDSKDVANSPFFTITLGHGTTGAPLILDLTHDASIEKEHPPYASIPTTPVINLPSVSLSGTNAFGCDSIAHPGDQIYQGGCLIIQGAEASSTTTLTHLGPLFKGSGFSHLLVQHLTSREPDATSLQGTASSAYPAIGTAIVDGQEFHTLTLDMIPNETTPVLNVNSFAAVATGGSGYAPGCTGSSCTDTLALPTGGPLGGVCTHDAKLIVNVSHGQVTGVQSILSPAQCTEYPRATSKPVPGVRPAGAAATGSGATFYVSYLPTPLSAWISNYNDYYAPGSAPPRSGAFTAYLHAYTNDPANPQRVVVGAGNGLKNFSMFGSPRIGPGGHCALHMFGAYCPVPPFQPDPEGHKLTWTLVETNPANSTAGHTDNPPYFTDPANMVCMHQDSSSAFDITDLAGDALTRHAAGQDVIIRDTVWIGGTRGVMRGVIGGQVLNTTIERDPDVYPAPCFSGMAGGMQLGQPGDPPVWGLLVQDYRVEATPDDPLAIFNDIGGTPEGSSGGRYRQSLVLNSLITNAAGRSINLYNDAKITRVGSAEAGSFPEGSCPTPQGYGTPDGVGSPTCVDNATRMNIYHCDTASTGQCNVTYTSN